MYVEVRFDQSMFQMAMVKNINIFQVVLKKAAM